MAKWNLGAGNKPIAGRVGPKRVGLELAPGGNQVSIFLPRRKIVGVRNRHCSSVGVFVCHSGIQSRMEDGKPVSCRLPVLDWQRIYSDQSGSNTAYRSLPSCFATYMAVSAAVIMASMLSACKGYSAIPMLAEMSAMVFLPNS